ncbi:MAG: hypothetical protein AAFQ27_12965, partial [Pseudomonadota bacterium]
LGLRFFTLQVEGLDAVIARSQTLISNAADNLMGRGGNSDDDDDDSDDDDNGGDDPVPAEHPRASFEVTGRRPDPTPDGKGITHTPSTSGNDEVLTVEGEGARVTIDGVSQSVGSDGQLRVSVPPGESRAIEVVYPAVVETETFDLFFLKDKPAERGFEDNPPSSSFLAYVNNTTSDPRFRNASAVRDASSQPAGDGSQRLQNWVRNNLSGSRSVSIEAFASFEREEREDEDKDLSLRRLEVAEAIVRRAGGRVTNRGWSGHLVAKGEGRRDAEIDRRASITGTVSNGSEVRITGTLSRPEVSQPRPRPNPNPNPNPTPTPTPAPSALATTPAAVSLKLKFVRQEERKTLTVVYNRQQAVERTFAPQGTFGLMLQGINKDEHFTSVNLDSAFFREFEIEASAPIDFDAIGLASAQVSIDYGSPEHSNGVIHREMSFRSGDDETQTKAFFLNEELDLFYKLGITYNFRGGTDWEGEELAYEIPATLSEDRSLHIDPHLHLGFKTVRVYPHRIDADVIDRIELALRYEDPTGWVATKRMNVKAGDPEFIWKLRQSSRNAPFSYSYQMTHHLLDGGTVVGDPMSTDLPELGVSDPFPHAINLFLIPAMDPGRTRLAIVEIEYDPGGGAPLRRKRVQVLSSQTSSIEQRFSITDPTRTTYRMRQTIIGQDSSVRVLPWEERTDTQIIIAG